MTLRFIYSILFAFFYIIKEGCRVTKRQWSKQTERGFAVATATAENQHKRLKAAFQTNRFEKYLMCMYVHVTLHYVYMAYAHAHACVYVCVSVWVCVRVCVRVDGVMHIHTFNSCPPPPDQYFVLYFVFLHAWYFLLLSALLLLFIYWVCWLIKRNDPAGNTNRAQ